jgi:hypothetical protein
VEGKELQVVQADINPNSTFQPGLGPLFCLLKCDCGAGLLAGGVAIPVEGIQSGSEHPGRI